MLEGAALGVSFVLAVTAFGCVILGMADAADEQNPWRVAGFLALAVLVAGVSGACAGYAM